MQKWVQMHSAWKWLENESFCYNEWYSLCAFSYCVEWWLISISKECYENKSYLILRIEVVKYVEYQINDEFIKLWKKFFSICEKYGTCIRKTIITDETFIGILGKEVRVESSSKTEFINRISVIAYVSSLVISTRIQTIPSLMRHSFL